jgi:hypothetical protein
MELRRRTHRNVERQRTEDDLVTLLPHLRDDRFPRINDTSEPDFDIFEVSKRLQDVLARDTHGAQSMKDRPTEESDLYPMCAYATLGLTCQIHQWRRTPAGSRKNKGSAKPSRCKAVRVG